jgi:hypothetical protein
MRTGVAIQEGAGVCLELRHRLSVHRGIIKVSFPARDILICFVQHTLVGCWLQSISTAWIYWDIVQRRNDLRDHSDGDTFKFNQGGCNGLYLERSSFPFFSPFFWFHRLGEDHRWASGCLSLLLDCLSTDSHIFYRAVMIFSSCPGFSQDGYTLGTFEVRLALESDQQ